MAAGDRLVTQVVVRALGTRPGSSLVTQFVVRVLGKLKTCTPTKCPAWMAEGLRRRRHIFAALWEIERTDGQTFYFTDHIGALLYSDGNTYIPTGGPAASAREHGAGESEHTAELTGAIIVGGVETNELEADQWNDAKVTERIVNWRFPWAGCYRHHRWYLRDVQWDGEKWTAQLSGITSRILGPIGGIYSRDCTNDLGDQEGEPAVVGCHYAVSATEESSDVDTVISDKRSFTTALTAAHIVGYFVNGRLTWTSGDNIGTTSIVSKAVETSAGVYQIEVEMSLPEDIQVGDDFDIQQGCQKRYLEDCTPKGQTQDFAGQRFMPGEDGLRVIPGAG